MFGIVGVATATSISLYFAFLLGPAQLEAWGTVEVREIHVGSKVGGRIGEVLVREGDRVEKGQLLVSFEDQELEAELAATRARLLFNPDSRSPNFFLPGLMAVLLIISTTFLKAFSLVREKERGTLEQLFVTPAVPWACSWGRSSPISASGWRSWLSFFSGHDISSACRFTAA